MRSSLQLSRAGLLLLAIILSVGSLVAQAGAVRARVTQAVDMQNLVTLRGNVHPWARPENDQGVAPDDLPMERMLLVLQRGQDQEAALRQLLDQQQVKSSPLFHQWLTPEQFGTQFGPADADIQAVTDWLASQGFTGEESSRGPHGDRVFGQCRDGAAGAGHGDSQISREGRGLLGEHQRPANPCRPRAGGGGLRFTQQLSRQTMMHENLRTLRRSPSRRARRSRCSPTRLFVLREAVMNNATRFAWAPPILPPFITCRRSGTTGTDGTGVTIAVVGETNINPQDVADFRSMFGLPANPPKIILNGLDPGIASDETEADLDVEWSGAVAKGATIDLVVSETTESTAGRGSLRALHH